MIHDWNSTAQRGLEVAAYIFRNSIDWRHPIESDQYGEVDIGNTMKLVEEVFR